jgi:DNA sulfur modification protein DndB
MNEEQKTKVFNALIFESEIQKSLKARKSEYFIESLDNGSIELEKKMANGWEVDSVRKLKTKVSKIKPDHTAFVDKVWALFAQLGFKVMNKERSFFLPCDKKNPLSEQRFDVFAKDDETVLIVECRSSEKNVHGDFNNDIENIKNKKAGIINSINSLFPLTKPKIKYILATRNFGISIEDQRKLTTIDAIHFSEEVIDYYYLLHSEIGLAARYQLLGALFAGQEIPDLENRIPAIEGKMGGHTYYSFSIEPEKLLKICYVLHRNKANENIMPTYQRLIKKNRLKDIHNFIDDQNGYFPNSIIINIVSNKQRTLVFERSNNQVPDAISRIGVLYLPKKYRSAYIIDGQHRLYGYSNSKLT